MGFSIHSTEVGGTLAALRLLHRLAAADDAATREILDATVLLVLPSQNPDGTDLVTDWYRRQLGTPFEGSAAPVLYHAYAGHDHNRDWYMFTQQETRLTVRHVYQRWHPQIVHDVHQMGVRGARLFVPPYVDPWEPNVDGALVAAANALGAHVASRLTTQGRTGIVTGAMFDAWTPGRAYPHTHGGVRLLSETASVRLATPIELEAATSSSAAKGLDPRAPSARFPLPWPGGALAARGRRRHAARRSRWPSSTTRRASAEHWLRTCARGEPPGLRTLARRSRSWCRRDQREPAAVARLLEVLRQGEVEVQRARGRVRRRTAGATGRGRTSSSCSSRRAASPRRCWSASAIPTSANEDGRPRRPYDVTAHTLPLLLGVDVEAVATPFAAELESRRVVRAAARAASRATGLASRSATRRRTSLALARLLAAGRRACAGRSSPSRPAAAAIRPARCSSPPPARARSSRSRTSWARGAPAVRLSPAPCA